MLCSYDKDRVAILKIRTYERFDGCNRLDEIQSMDDIDK